MGVSSSREGDSFKSYAKFFDKKTEELLVDLQERAYEQYPELKELKQSCTVTDNSFPDNPIVWVNDEFERMTLYPKEEIIGRNCRFLQGPKTNPLTIQNVKRSIVLGTQIEVEILNYRKDGVAFWNRFFIYPIYERNGIKVTHFIAIQKDVTGAKLGDLGGLDWSVCEVAVWLGQIGLEEYAEAFREAQIDGSELLGVKESVLRKTIGMNTKAIEKFMQEREDLEGRSSIFGDSDSQTSMSRTGSQFSFDAKKFLKKRARERIAIKCYLDSETIRIFAVKRKTSLKRFCRILKKEFNKRFQVIPIGSENPCDEEGWMKIMNEATEETVRVFIAPQVKRTVSTKLFNRGESKAPSRMTSQEELEAQKSIDLVFIQSLQNNNKTPETSDFMAVLNEEKEFLNLVNQTKFTSNMKFPSLLFDFFYNHDATDSLFQWVVKRELKTYPSPTSFFRDSTLTTNIFSVLFQNEMARHFLHSTVGITIKKVLSHGKLEIESARTKKDTIASSIKWINEEIMNLMENLEKNLNFCPLPIREGFSHLFSVLKEKSNSEVQPLDMVSSIFFLRFISPVFMDPMRFGIATETKMDDSQFRSLVIFSKVLQWIANDSVIDSSKSYSTPLQNLVKIGNPMVKKLITNLIDQKDLNQAKIMSKCYHFVTPLAKLSSLTVIQSL
eukprot:TRINITY_DN1569_c0_g1_i1.p1 TRINITY_DN1569_c0_g1~~TRINITY_DN1569_c0_g1_i1.p1  ORF type:complete len:668 (-),score=196.11 TRINITY_DN1569_c0_g1_i1:40-2043(-)